MIPPPCPKVIIGAVLSLTLLLMNLVKVGPQPTASDRKHLSRYPQPTGIVPTAKGINYGPNDVVLVNGLPLGPPVLGPLVLLSLFPSQLTH